MTLSRRTLVLVLFLSLLGACSRGPQAIAYGRDGCDYCRMVISDSRYGAELVTAKGKVHKFDSIECLASYYVQARRTDGATSVRSLWVTDFAHPGTLVPAATARFARQSGLGSPMGKGLTAFAPGADSAAVARLTNGAPTMRWDDVLAIVEREGMPQGAAPAQGAGGGGGSAR